jgi:phosphoserine phosphatase
MRVNAMLKPKLLVQFDVDSTFIQQEAIELLAKRAGVLDEVSQITQSAMNGDMDFAQSLTARVELLKGLPVQVIDDVRDEILLTDGAAELVDQLHKLGHSVSLVSGGFVQIMEPIVSKLSIKYFRANVLGVQNGHLTGKVSGTIIDRAAKAHALIEFARLSDVLMENTVAIGDGANDLDMMEAAGLSIAFNAKPIVTQAADFAINEPTLRPVAQLLKL